MDRREFVKGIAAAGTFGATAPWVGKSALEREEDLFQISLSQWGFHRAILGNARDNYSEFIKTLNTNPDGVLKGYLDSRDIVVKAKEFGVGTVDLVNILWFGHARDEPWLDEFKRRAEAAGVGFGVLMCDQTGLIGARAKEDRKASIELHKEWFEAAAYLGCPYLRVNPYGEGNYLQQCRQCAESLKELGDLSADFGLEVLVENHGHPGSNGAWLAMLMEMADHPRVGVYTDFDNFFMGGWGLVPERRYDRLQGLLDLAPYTRSVSAKSHDFGPDGEETTIDYNQCLRTVLDAGFRGLASAEFEGDRLSEQEGSRLTAELLKRERKKLKSAYS
ncbi:MAG: sugar phosphate isomerase/epimerase family protein [Verrucomicrobiota bacterium]